MKSDRAADERAVRKPRFQIDVKPAVDVRLAADAVGKFHHIIGRKAEREHRRLQVVEAADLVAAATRQVRIARRRQTERAIVAALVIPLIHGHRLVPEPAPDMAMPA